MQDNWVSTSDLYKLMSPSQRKQFTERLSYSKDFANHCFENPEMLKEFTEEDQQAILRTGQRTERLFLYRGPLMDKRKDF